MNKQRNNRRGGWFVIVALIAAVGGWWLGRFQSNESDNQLAERKPLYWVAPMDSSFRRDEPGLSPMGMALVPVYEEQASAAQPGLVRIAPGVAANLGLITATAEWGELQPEVEAVARVAVDESRLIHVHTRVSGWVKGLRVRATGDRVAHGQLLFGLYAPELVAAQEEFLLARRMGDGPLQSAARQRLSALGLSQAVIDQVAERGAVMQEIPVYAHASGYLMHLMVREGKFVTPDSDVMSIAAADHVWLIADVLQSQAALIQTGQQVVVALSGQPELPQQAEVDYVYPELDPRSLTARVRMLLTNTDERLRPGMYANVRIQTRPLPASVHIPRSALIDDGRSQRVIVREDGGFRARTVNAGLQVGQRICILNGLQAGESVVVNGQFLIDSEAAFAAESQRLSGADDAENEQQSSGQSTHHPH